MSKRDEKQDGPGWVPERMVKVDGLLKMDSELTREDIRTASFVMPVTAEYPTGKVWTITRGKWETK